MLRVLDHWYAWAVSEGVGSTWCAVFFFVSFSVMALKGTQTSLLSLRPIEGRLRRLQRASEVRQELVPIFQANANTHKALFNAVLRCPVKLRVMRKDDVRAREGEVRAKAGALLAPERVVERAARCRRREGHAEQSAVPACRDAVLADATALVVLRCLPFGIVDVLDDSTGRRRVRSERAVAEEGAYGEGIVVDDFDAPAEVARIAFHEDGVFVEVEVFIHVGDLRFKVMVVSSTRIQDKTGAVSEQGDSESTRAHLPPMTFASPLKILLKLLTTMSA